MRETRCERLETRDEVIEARTKKQESRLGFVKEGDLSF